MSINAKQVEEQMQVKRYKIQYPISAYTFPTETYIDQVRFDNEYIHIELTDRRVISIPMSWVPTVYNASPEERAKYELSRDRTMIIWDPDKCAINDELRVSDYLEPIPTPSHSVTRPKIARRKRASPKHRMRA